MARSRTTCRYCGQPAHVPADSCLTLGQKVGRIVGWTGVYVLAILLLIGGVVWLTQAMKPDPHAGQVCVPNAIGSGCHWEFR
jgi:hypothetical protein